MTSCLVSYTHQLYLLLAPVLVCDQTPDRDVRCERAQVEERDSVVGPDSVVVLRNSECEGQHSLLLEVGL